MPIQYGPPTIPIRYGSASAGTAAQPLLAGSFASAFSRRPAAAAKKRPASSAAPVSQTLAQVANQRVNQQLNPQIAAQDAFNAHQNAVIQSFANSLLGKMQPIAGQVGASYDTAIGQQGALANQAAQFLSNANPTGQVHDLLASINAPQEQQTQLANQFGQTFGGGAGVLSFTGGAIPGSQMAANKAAAVGEAAQLPGFAALKGQQDLASALWQQGQDRRTLEATRPALYQAAAQDIRQNNAARATAGATARQNAITNARENRKINIGVGEFNIGRQDKLNAAQAKTVTDAAAAHKQSAKDFLKWLYSPGVEAQNYKNEDLVGIAKSVFGLDLGKGFSVTAPPAKPNIHFGANGEISRINPDGSIDTLRDPTAKPNPTRVISDKTGQWLVDARTGAQIARVGGPTGSTGTVTTKTIKGVGGKTLLVNSKTGAVIATYQGPKKPPKLAAGQTFTNSDVASLAGDVRSWHTGVTGTQNGQPVVDPGSQLNWNQAYQRATTRLPNTKAGKAKALSLVNAEYGNPESIAFTHAMSDTHNHVGLTDSVKGFLAANSVPLAAAIAATARAYRVKPSDVRGIVSELQQLVSSGQVSLGG